MKKLLVILFTFVAISCTDEKPTEPNYGSAFERLIGKWDLLYIDGGFGGGRRYPKEKSTLQFYNDSTLKWYSNNDEGSKQKFVLIKDASEYKENDSAWFLKIPSESVDPLYPDEYQEIEFHHDTLILIDVNYKQGITLDGYWATLKRIR